eukprot:GILI01027260.1.p1 GENE.GILI01027260.1~~GILI01027260.1.p1  ORF type:complete len:262 (+),score=22.28 GILI01027260.1:70-786(+)
MQGFRCASRVLRCAPAAIPAPMRSTFIDRDPSKSGITRSGVVATSTFHNSLMVSDITLRPIQWAGDAAYRPQNIVAAGNRVTRAVRYANGQVHSLETIAKVDSKLPNAVAARLGANYGDSKKSQEEQLSTRWGKMFFGNLFHGPRNYLYRGSRWYLRRYKMKKHRYKKRWTRRRYKLAAIANLPHARMVRISMLPEIRKQSKVSGSESNVADLISNAFQTASTKKGTARSRPYSRYQT